MQLRWEWRPNWAWDHYEGYYLDGYRQVLCCSENGHDWREVPGPEHLTPQQIKELLARYPKP